MPENCPECGVDMEGKDPKKHAISHWGPDFNKIKEDQNPSAVRRIRALLN